MSDRNAAQPLAQIVVTSRKISLFQKTANGEQAREGIAAGEKRDGFQPVLHPLQPGQQGSKS
jgi:hypothetical protein